MFKFINVAVQLSEQMSRIDCASPNRMDIKNSDTRGNGTGKKKAAELKRPITAPSINSVFPSFSRFVTVEVPSRQEIVNDDK